MKKTNSKKGFTLVELVIVIAVIAILSAILIPTFGNIISDANETKARSAAKNAITAKIEDSRVDFPAAIIECTEGGSKFYFMWTGTVLEDDDKDEKLKTAYGVVGETDYAAAVVLDADTKVSYRTKK